MARSPTFWIRASSVSPVITRMAFSKPTTFRHCPGATASTASSMRVVRLRSGRLSISPWMVWALMGVGLLGVGSMGSLEPGEVGQVELLEPVLTVELGEVGVLRADLDLEAVGDEDGRATVADLGDRVVAEPLLGGLELVEGLGVAHRVEDRQCGDGLTLLDELGLGEARLLLAEDDVEVALGLGEELVEQRAGHGLLADGRGAAAGLLLDLVEA